LHHYPVYKQAGLGGGQAEGTRLGVYGESGCAGEWIGEIEAVFPFAFGVGGRRGRCQGVYSVGRAGAVEGGLQPVAEFVAVGIGGSRSERVGFVAAEDFAIGYVEFRRTVLRGNRWKFCVED